MFEVEMKSAAVVLDDDSLCWTAKVAKAVCSGIHPPALVALVAPAVGGLRTAHTVTGHWRQTNNRCAAITGFRKIKVIF